MTARRQGSEPGPHSGGEGGPSKCIEVGSVNQIMTLENLFNKFLAVTST